MKTQLHQGCQRGEFWKEKWKSTFNAWKMARVATGSTAEIIEPNAKLSAALILYIKSAWQ